MSIIGEELLLAIDLGTSGPKVAVLTAKGEVVSSSIGKTDLYQVKGGGYEQSPQNWWEVIKENIHIVLSSSRLESRNIVGISCTGQWSGTVPIDIYGSPLMNALIWMDNRGAPYIKKVIEGGLNVDGYSVSKILHWIYKTGGAPGKSGKDPIAHILYIKNECPKVYKQTYKFLEPKDYLNYCFTGKIATSADTVAIHWVTNNRLISKIEYDKSLLSTFGIERHLLPDIFNSTDVLGTIRPEISKEFSLEPSVKLIVGSPDIHTAAIGAGTVNNYKAHLYLGTSSWLTCHVPFKKTSFTNGMASLPSALPGKYLIANEQQSAGSCISYLKDNLFRGFSELNGYKPSNSDEDIFILFEKILRETEPGSDNLIFTPWLNGERCPIEDDFIRGGFHNLSLRHNAKHLVRAVYEGVCYNSKWLLQAVEKFVNRPFDSIVFIGGGALSHEWCQIFADVLERKVIQLKDSRYVNARGAAWLAALGLKLVKEEEIPAFSKVEKTFLPRRDLVPTYRVNFEQFLRIARSHRKICSKLNSIDSVKENKLIELKEKESFGYS